MEQYFLQFLNIYFWVFLTLSCSDFLIRLIVKNLKSDIEFKDASPTFLNRIIVITLFIMSIILT